MAWTVDPGLQVLLAQINAAAPNRSKASDGSIGDPAHQAGTSDHNPEYPAPAGNPAGEVDARDFTHDPRYAGSDMHQVTEAIRLSRDPRVAYVIWNRRIYSGAAGPSPWVWRGYAGDNPHDKHAHVSVRDVNRGTQPWAIALEDDMSAAAEQMIRDLHFAMFNAADAATRPLPSALGILHTIRAQTGKPTEIDYDKLAAAIVAKLPESTLTKADVKAAVSDVLLHGALVPE